MRSSYSSSVRGHLFNLDAGVVYIWHVWLEVLAITIQANPGGGAPKNTAGKPIAGPERAHKITNPPNREVYHAAGLFVHKAC